MIEWKLIGKIAVTAIILAIIILLPLGIWLGEMKDKGRQTTPRYRRVDFILDKIGLTLLIPIVLSGLASLYNLLYHIWNEW